MTQQFHSGAEDLENSWRAAGLWSTLGGPGDGKDGSSDSSRVDALSKEQGGQAATAFPLELLHTRAATGSCGPLLEEGVPSSVITPVNTLTGPPRGLFLSWFQPRLVITNGSPLFLTGKCSLVSLILALLLMLLYERQSYAVFPIEYRELKRLSMCFLDLIISLLQSCPGPGGLQTLVLLCLFLFFDLRVNQLRLCVVSQPWLSKNSLFLGLDGHSTIHRLPCRFPLLFIPRLYS